MPPNPTRRRYLQFCAGGASAALAGCSSLVPFAGAESRDDDPEKIDDWQYDPDDGHAGDGNGASGGADNGASFDSAAGTATATESETIGLAAGGAKDVATFRRNVEEGYLPIPESMPYEGLFYNYYFDTGGDGSCSDLFCPTYSPAVTPDPLSGETERYLTVGLDSGMAQSDFERKPLNLVVVLDISGSMSSAFDEYYYDRFGNRQEPEGETDRPKIAVARDALVALTEQLRPEDRLGVVLFDNRSYLAKPLRPVEATDMDAIRDHIESDVRARGGTNIEAGIDRATDLLAEYEGVDPAERENRTVLLTDAQPNLGETSTGGLRETLEDNAATGLYTTFVGIGLDFNAELVDEITAIRGSNYYSVHSAEEFERRMGEQFEYMMTPLVFDLSLEIDADGYRIQQVYGSTAAEEATDEIMSVNTLFPSPSEDGQARGGVVLVEVERTADDAAMALTASWETRNGREHGTVERISFPDGTDERFGSTAVRKAVLLARHADLLKTWTISEREVDADHEPVVADGDGIAPPPERYLGKWEQQSDPLTVSARNEERLREFRTHLAGEVEAVGDEDLQQELDLVTEILDKGTAETDEVGG
ncbi:MAG: VWA domain-containing protein [Halovenus sp.]